MVIMQEFGIIVSYDCRYNKIRQTIVKICKDYNLSRIQYSVFSGAMSATAYNNFVERMKAIPLKTPLSVLIQRLPIGSANDFEIIEYEAEKLKRFKSYRRGNVI